MENKKLLHVISNMNPQFGGVCEALRTIIPTLNNNGIHNEVVSLDASDVTFVTKDTFMIHQLGPGKGPWQYSAKLIPWLVDNLSNFDYVIIHGLWLFHGYAVRRALIQVKRKQALSFKNSTPELPKVVVFPHGMLDPYFQLAPGRKLKALRNYLYWRLIEGKVVNEADAIFFTAEDELELARTTFKPYKPKIESVVGLGIINPPPSDIGMKEAFQEKCPELQEAPYWLYLGRVNEKKGVDILIMAYKLLLQSEIDVQLPKLVIAGPGLDSEFGKKVQQMAADLEKKIVFPGMLTGNAKWGAFYGCEAFILPTHQENFGIAIVEALACKKPVLISNKTNIWREIENSGGGFIETDTVAGTLKLLQRWQRLRDEEKREMEEKAFKTYQSHFSTQSMENKWVSMISSGLYAKNWR